MRAFQCRGCGTVVFVPEEAPDPLWCPLCRLGLVEVHLEPPPNLKQWHCPECGADFWMQPDEAPYKCAYCNYTFPSTERRLFKEKL